MTLDRRTSSDQIPMAGITGRITIEIGWDSDGQRGISFHFEDLLNTDEDGNTQLLGYFDGKMALAAAQDEFMMKHLFPADDDE